MRPWMIGLAGAAAGSVLTAFVFTATQEAPLSPAVDGKTSSPGNRPSMASTRPEFDTDAARPTPSQGGGTGPSAPAATRAGTTATAPATALSPAELQRQNVVLLEENRALQEQLAALKETMEKGAANKKETYDLSPAELKQMAQNCELRWDMPSLTAQPPRISDKDMTQLALSESEREIINRKFAASHARLIQTVRSTYRTMTGDEAVGSMSVEAMFAELSDKVPQADMQALFKRLSHERAGLLAPAADTASLPPMEKLFRVLTSEGDALEQALAQELGPELASKIRDQNNGWSSKFRSTHGCPR